MSTPFLTREMTEGKEGHLRLAGLADAPTVARLFRLAMETENRRFNATYPIMDAEEWERYAQYLAYMLPNRDHAILLSDVGGEVVGMIAGQIINRPFGKPHRFAKIFGLWMDPERRRSGLAQELLSGIAQWAEARGVHTMEWDALAGDTKWTARGYAPFQTSYASTWITGKTTELLYSLTNGDTAA